MPSGCPARYPAAPMQSRRLDLNRNVVELLCKSERVAAPVERSGGILGRSAKGGGWRRHGELGARAEGLSQLDCLISCPKGLGCATDETEYPCQSAKRVSFRHGVAELAARLAAGLRASSASWKLPVIKHSYAYRS